MNTRNYYKNTRANFLVAGVNIITIIVNMIVQTNLINTKKISFMTIISIIITIIINIRLT